MARLQEQAPTAVNRLGDAVAGVGIVPAYQPIVALPDGVTVGYEALARWPSLDDPRPQAVFEYAAEHGGLDGLDQSCITAGVDVALRNDLAPGTMLLVNCEPTSTYVGPDDDQVLASGRDRLRVTFEFTERSLLAHPQALLRKLARIRADGFSIALDDVGAHPDSLAMLDVVRPDIIKLDLALVQSDPSRDQARTLSAVLAHHERTGAVILAEGIENDHHLEQALALGADLGQGYKYGRARSLEEHGDAAPWSMPRERNVVAVDSQSPFDLASRLLEPRTARKRTLLAFSRHIESQARHAADPPMLMTALQRATYFTPRTRMNYQAMAAELPLVAVFGEDLPDDLGHGVRGVPLASDDPLRLEWTVVILGPHTASALIARERDTPEAWVADGDRRFDVVMTHDRSLVTMCVRSLLDRMC
ncbi:sensor domain-containing phosphodiesterase [Mycolicibacterium arabiense]|uniref:sensor domain-containing phosphodiesterase n=1 Tax=Mycolicibacterium arabiense TaxID=1286181 RepID=UPI001F293B9A|nr:EAL domain-containing protein [Mycolicibacterium arabiense]